MTEDQLQLLKAARRSIDSARHLQQGGYFEHAVSRAYYAMFYMAEAFLETEGMAFSKRSAVIAAFGQHFAREGKVPAEFHRYLIKAEELRGEGDYSLEAISKEAAQEQIARAEQFPRLAERLIGPIPPSGEQL